MPHIISLGDILVEIMRRDIDQPLNQPGEFVGPYPSGASAIFIDAAARMGGSAGYIGVVGADDFGACVTNRLRTDGVDISPVRTAPGYTTGVAFVTYRSDGSRQFVFHLPQSAAAQLMPGDVPDDYAARAKFVHVTGSALSTSESVKQACYKAARLCRKAGGKVSFDPNIRPELLGIEKVREICQPILELCEVLLPSGVEASMLTGQPDPAMACRALVRHGVPIVALKRGSQGSTVFTRSVEFDVPALSIVEVDPTGAGDCFGGAFIVALLEGWDVRRAARFANVCGALSVTRRGPMEGIPMRDEVLKKM